MKEYTFKNMVFDMVMEAWILWVIIRYLRTH